MFKQFRIVFEIAITSILIAFSSLTPASQYDTELLALTNTERQNAGLPALTLSSQLGQAAQNHAEDMAINNYFDHTGLNGSRPSERAEAMGYNFSYVGENISAGRTTPSDAIQGWMNSQGHRENILNPNYTEIGFGYAYSDYSDYGYYWVQVFGKSTGTSTISVTDFTDTSSVTDFTDASLVWHTSKAEAVSLAQNEGKLILLVAGRDTCGNTNHTRDTLFETNSPPIKQQLQDNFILWYANVDFSTEHYSYTNGLESYTLPLIATIDPNNSDSYIDRTTDVQTPDAFYARLENVAPPITIATTQTNDSQSTPVSNGEVWQAPPAPSSQGYIPIDRFRADDGNLWQNSLRSQPSGVFPDGTYDATQFPPEAYKQAIEGFFQIRYACEASWYGGAKDLGWIPANVIGAIEYCVYPENIAEVINHLRSTADSLACSAGLEPCQ